jgi:hypothetical protein
VVVLRVTLCEASFENFNRRSRGGAIFWATDPEIAATPEKGFETQVLGHTSRLYFFLFCIDRK